LAWTKQQEAEIERERAAAAEKNLEKQLVETQRQFERWQFVEGSAWLVRARLLKGEGNHLSALLYAGRAVGFHGYGRLDEVESGPAGISYPSLLGARFTDPDGEKERAREEAEVRDFVRQVRPTCLPIWSSSLSDQNAAPVTSVAFSPDGIQMASGSDDGTVRIWCAVSGRQVATLRGLSNPIWGLVFSPDGTRLAAGSRDRRLRLWDAISGKEIASLDTGESRNFRSPPVRPSGFRLEGAEIPQEKAKIAKTEWVFSSIVFSRDGKRLACGTGNGTVKIWDAANGRELQCLDGHSGAIRCLALNSDGSRIATGSRDATVKLWDMESGRELLKIDGKSVEINRVAFSPDGARLACGFDNGAIGLWDSESGRRIVVKEDEKASDYGPIKSLLFSPDGTRLASSSSGKAMRLLSAEDLEIIANLGDDSGWIANMAFSPDGKLLACASPDGTVKLWGGANGNPLATIREHAARVMSVAFSPDGTRLLSGAEDGNLKLWDVSIAVSSDLRQPMDLLALQREGYLQLVDREVVWENNPQSPDDRVLAPIHWRNDLTAQLAEAASEAERDVLRLKMTGQSRQWRAMLGIWQQAKDSGMAGHAAMRREFVAQAAVTLRQLSSLNQPEFPMDLWLALLAACEGQDNQDPRLTLAVSEMMRVLFLCDDTPENLLLAIADGCRQNAFLRAAAASALPIHSDSGNRAADRFSKMIQSEDGASVLSSSAQDRLESMQAKPQGVAVDDDEADQVKPPKSPATTTPVGYVSALDSQKSTLGSLSFEGRHGRFSACGALALMAGKTVEWRGAGSLESYANRQLWSRVMSVECVNIALSACGGVAAAIGADGSAVLWQVDKDMRLEIGADEGISPNGLFLGAGGRCWASVDRSGRTLLRALPGGNTVAELYAAAPQGVVLAYAPDGRWLAGTNRADNHVAQIFDAGTGELRRRLDGHGGIVMHVAVSRDGKHVVTSSADGTARIWEAASGRMRAVLDGHGGTVNKSGFDRMSMRVVTAAADGRARVWSLDGQLLSEEVRIPGNHELTHAGFSPDGRLLATASKDGRLRLWHAKHGKLLFDAAVDTSFLDDDMFSPDGNHLILPGGLAVGLYSGIAGLAAEQSEAANDGKEDVSPGGEDEK
jgi:WD40 repeat protein